MTTMFDVMTFLLNRSGAGLPLSMLSGIFDQLIWCLEDNGKEIEEVRRKWLASSDRREVEVALYMSETFPYDTYSDLEDCYNNISEKWPDLDIKCSEILANWKRQFSD